MPKDALHDLELLFRSRHGLIYLDTREEDRANSLLAHVADRLRVPFFTWTRSKGLSRADLDSAVYETEEPTKALQHVALAELEAVYHFQSLAGSLAGKDLLISILRDAFSQVNEENAFNIDGARGPNLISNDEK